MSNDAIIHALLKTSSITKAARLLQIPRSTLQYEMQKRGITIRRVPVIEPIPLALSTARRGGLLPDDRAKAICPAD